MTRPFSPRAALALSCLLVLAVYAPVLGFGFVSWDDPVYVTDNPLLRGEGGLRDWLLTPALGYPIPVTVASYRAEVGLFGVSSSAMHATNLLLHLLCVLGTFAVGRGLGLGVVGATVAALVLGLHPASAEPVSWVTGRKDLLACLGCLAALGLVLRGRRGPAAVASLLALLSKPVAAFLPLFLLLRPGRGRSAPADAALPALSAALVVPLSWWGLRGIEAPAAPRSVGEVLQEVAFAAGHAVGLVGGWIAPVAVQQPPAMPPAWTPAVAVAPLAIGMLVVLARVLGADLRVAAAGGLWALLAWLPASNLLPLTRYLADSYVYLPLVGVGWFAGALVEAVPRRVRPGAGVAGALLLAVMGVSAAGSSARWADSATLWEHTAQARPDDPRACRNAGNGWLAQDRPEQALARYTACRERHGAAAFDKNIAITLCVLRRFEEARPLLERLVDERPGDATLRRYLAGVQKALAAPTGDAPDR